MNPSDWESAAKKEWDDQATLWNERSKVMWKKGSRKDIVPFMNNYLHTGSKVLDIGCGNGYGTYLLNKAGIQAEGIDLSLEMIKFAQERFKHQHISFQQGSILDLPCSSNEYDGVLAINVLEWTRNPSLALMEIKRILKQKGIVCAGILGPTAGPRIHGYRRVYGEEVIINSMMPWDFTRMASENGFTLKDSFGVHKKGITDEKLEGFSFELKQAVSFMWVFIFEKSE